MPPFDPEAIQKAGETLLEGSPEPPAPDGAADVIEEPTGTPPVQPTDDSAGETPGEADGKPDGQPADETAAKGEAEPKPAGDDGAADKPDDDAKPKLGKVARHAQKVRRDRQRLEAEKAEHDRDKRETRALLEQLRAQQQQIQPWVEVQQLAATNPSAAFRRMAELTGADTSRLITEHTRATLNAEPTIESLQTELQAMRQDFAAMRDGQAEDQRKAQAAAQQAAATEAFQRDVAMVCKLAEPAKTLNMEPAVLPAGHPRENNPPPERWKHAAAWRDDRLQVEAQAAILDAYQNNPSASLNDVADKLEAAAKADAQAFAARLGWAADPGNPQTGDGTGTPDANASNPADGGNGQSPGGAPRYTKAKTPTNKDAAAGTTARTMTREDRLAAAGAALQKGIDEGVSRLK
jgi:hypothetical protein